MIDLEKYTRVCQLDASWKPSGQRTFFRDPGEIDLPFLICAAVHHGSDKDDQKTTAPNLWTTS
jgi:hypothetical protein